MKTIFKDQRGAVDMMLAALIVLVVAVAGFVLWQVQDSNDLDGVGSSQADNSSTSAPTETSQPADEAADPTDIATTALTYVGDEQGAAYGGTAERLNDNGTFRHEVIANLPDPAEGKFYEGWLVGSSVVSTGKLAQELEGEWSLVFESQDDLLSHNEVVITEETLANGLDGVPEIHVLEGSF